MHGKSYYEALTDRVAKIDKGAARYMRKHAPSTLRSFTYNGYLAGCFVWSDTPQGHDFWEDINDKLNNEDM